VVDRLKEHDRVLPHSYESSEETEKQSILDWLLHRHVMCRPELIVFPAVSWTLWFTHTILIDLWFAWSVACSCFFAIQNAPVVIRQRQKLHRP